MVCMWWRGFKERESSQRDGILYDQVDQTRNKTNKPTSLFVAAFFVCQYGIILIEIYSLKRERKKLLTRKMKN